jgi:peptidoglycan-associated lipoprotein
MIPSRRDSFAVLSILLCVGLMALVGCHSPEPASPSADLTGASAPKTPDLGRGAPRVRTEAAYHVYVADPVRQVCSGSVPFFEFDSSSTREADQPTMQVLADCMLTGPLSGKTVKLIGHTDPRGTEGYNDKLGLERAERVREYLVAHKVDAARVQVESQGKQGASATPDGWPTDRRVEIQLVP